MCFSVILIGHHENRTPQAEESERRERERALEREQAWAGSLRNHSSPNVSGQATVSRVNGMFIGKSRHGRARPAARCSPLSLSLAPPSSEGQRGKARGTGVLTLERQRAGAGAKVRCCVQSLSKPEVGNAKGEGVCVSTTTREPTGSGSASAFGRTRGRCARP